MSDSTKHIFFRPNRLAWLILPMLLVAVLTSGAIGMLKTHAAAPAVSSLSGNYAFRAITTSGPKKGLYITGQLEMLVTGTTVSGHMCGLISSYCAVISGTTDGTNVDFVVHSADSFPAIHATGKLVNNLIHKGGSGFAGTFVLGTGTQASSGSWTGLTSLVPSLAGKWHLYAVTQYGSHKGRELHGDITLVAGANGTYSGTYCPASGSCVTVKGEDLGGYVRIYIGSPTTVVLRGTYTFNHGHIASGQFYASDTSGDKGYWLIFQ